MKEVSITQTIKQIYENHKDDVYGYLYSLTRDATLSEDLTSETFLAAIHSLPRFKGEASIKTWLFSIARHKWYESMRKGKREITTDELTQNYLNNGNYIPENDSASALHRISEILNEESTTVQKVFTMRVEGYSFHEIAHSCSISENSARVIAFRVKAKIKDKLQKEGYYE